jgi:hypothetical protein
MNKTAHQNASESKTRKWEALMIEMSVDLSNMDVNGQGGSNHCARQNGFVFVEGC